MHRVEHEVGVVVGSEVARDHFVAMGDRHLIDELPGPNRSKKSLDGVDTVDSQRCQRHCDAEKC